MAIYLFWEKMRLSVKLMGTEREYQALDNLKGRREKYTNLR